MDQLWDVEDHQGGDVAQSPALEKIVKENDKFPEGMRVLAVDDNIVSLQVLQGYLKQCRYHARVTTSPSEALKLLREKESNFDLVITDVHMPTVDDGFEFLATIGLQMNIPVVMMSVDADQKLVMKGIEHGACDYLLKPIRLEEIKNIWQHVVRKRVVGKSKSNSADSNTEKDTMKLQPSEQPKTDTEQNKEEVTDVRSDKCSDPKKQRVSWGISLHSKFIAAFNELGGADKAVPSKILEKMNVPWLSREKVASHLQKYRNGLKKSKSLQNRNNDGSYGIVEPQPSHSPMPSDKQRYTKLKQYHRSNSEVSQYGNLVQHPHTYRSSSLNSMALPIMMRPLQHQFYHGGFGYHPASSLRPNACTDHMEPSFQPHLGSYHSLDYQSCPHPVENFSGSAELLDISAYVDILTPQDPLTREIQTIPSGQHEGNGVVDANMQTCNLEDLASVNQDLMEEDLLEMEINDFRNSSCSSSEDLTAVVKQFQQ